ncbi:MAG TPA: terminase family protein [Archangium sp.]|uniref:terminase large subunit domain-containing protein n=1 Tax=Archangium sp. TaxID=1872627 RepID=UPI002E2FCA43|nr:terminase family protein [Archangium sp.]HEX5750014.1 terminase family protein [Archangium sp.]
MATPAVSPPSRNPFAGIPILSSDNLGRFSLSDLAAMKFREQLRKAEKVAEGLASHPGIAEQLRLNQAEVLAWYYEPRFWLRPVQQPPPDSTKWRTWFFLGGRGTGKTYAGSVAVLEEARKDPNARILIVGPTDSEIRKNQLEGLSGILTLAPPWFKPVHQRSKRTLVFPNGALAFYVPAQAGPDKFRGYNVTFVWLDEIVAWKKKPEDVYEECRKVARVRTPRMEQLDLPARLVITTTPAPTPLFEQILAEKEGLYLARSTTLDNAANLDPATVRRALRLINTTDGRREYGGELFWGMSACIYQCVNWNASRVKSLAAIPERRDAKGELRPLFDKIVVGVDPATGEKVNSDQHGIVVEGIREEADGLVHTYVLEDLSMRSPESSAWAKVAVDAVHRWKHLAPRRKTFIFAETNTGGSLVKDCVRNVDATVKVKGERARQSKAERAAPVSQLAEAGLVHMVGKHHELEKQLAKFTGQEGGHARDDRADAFAWPIFKYVCPKRENKGALKKVAEAGQQQEDEDNEE